MPVVRPCQSCKKDFSQGKRSILQKYCSYACRSDALRARGSKECVCEYCGDKFFKNNSQFTAYKNAGKFCSRECGYKGRVATTAKKPIADKYGRSSRKADQDWKKAVREKDDFTCQRCGVRQEYIHTHHVAMRSTYPELKHEVTNGKCLCNSCHSWVHNNPKEAAELGLLLMRKYETKPELRLISNHIA